MFIGGAVVQWLRDELKFVTSAAETIGNTCQPSLIGNIFIPASLRIQIAVSRIEIDVFIESEIHTGFPDGCIL